MTQRDDVGDRLATVSEEISPLPRGSHSQRRSPELLADSASKVRSGSQRRGSPDANAGSSGGRSPEIFVHQVTGVRDEESQPNEAEGDQQLYNPVGETAFDGSLRMEAH